MRDANLGGIVIVLLVVLAAAAPGFAPPEARGYGAVDEASPTDPGTMAPRAFLPAAHLPAAQDPPTLGPRAVTTATGLRYEDVVTGTGDLAEPGTRATIHFAAYLDDGRLVDDSRARGMAFRFRLGDRYVIAGFDEGVTGMRVGGRRHLVVPPELAYGEAGHPPLIPPNATMRFAVELLAVERGEP